MADQSFGDELRALETRTTRTDLMRRAEEAEARAAELQAENERLREFAFGPAPEWERANASLKHRVRELEFFEACVGDLKAALNDMELHDDTGDPFDQGYMRAVRELQAVLKGD